MTDLPFERAFRSWCRDEGVRWSTLRYPRHEAGGETVAHRLIPAHPPRAGVLVVHGAGNDALFSLTGLFAELLRRGLEIFTFDLDGHGRASTTPLKVDTAAGAIPAAVEAWGASDRGLPVHALGISLGGSLLLHALPGLGSAVFSAALLSAPLQVRLSWKAIAREVGPPMIRTLWRERSRFGLTGLIPSFGPFRRDIYPLRLGDPPGPGAFGYVEVVNRLLDRLDLLEAAPRVQVPVLVVHGGRDRLVPAAQARAVSDALRRAELLLLPDDTHLSAPLAPLARERVFGWISAHQPADRRAE